VVLTFVPLRWVHPMRTPLLWPVTLLLTAVWIVTAFLTIVAGFPAAPLAKWILLLAAAYGVGLALLRGRVW
jgi:phosphatidylcholine synthase